MIKASVLYPNTEGKKFNTEYYFNKHLPMIRQKLGTALKNVTADVGLGGATPGSPPTYIVMGHLYFDSLEAFQSAFVLHGQALMADIPNFTDIQPTVQISEVKM